MIEINLLPESYFKARRKKKIMLAVITAGFLAAAVLIGLYLLVFVELTNTNTKIQKVEAEQQKYTPILDEIDNIKKIKEFLKKRSDAIEDLKELQTLWLLLLDDFNRCIPNNLWLTSVTNKLEATGFRTFNVDGTALFKEVVADFIYNINNNAHYLKSASLVTLVETNVSGKIMYSFKITFQSVEETKIKPPKEIAIKDVSKSGIVGNTYVNVEYRCSLFKPDGWVMTDVTPLPNIIVLLTKEKKELGKASPSVSLVVEKLQSSLATSKEYANIIEQSSRKVFVKYNKVYEGEKIINNLKCYETVFTWETSSKIDKGKKVLLKQRQICYVQGQIGYVLTCIDTLSNFESNSADFFIIISNFKII